MKWWRQNSRTENITEGNNSMNGLYCRLNTTEERITEIKDKIFLNP